MCFARIRPVRPCRTKTHCATRLPKQAGFLWCQKLWNEKVHPAFASLLLKIMLNRLTITELTKKLAAREVSSREAMQSCLDQVARVDGQIHAFISHDAADALAQADA